MLALSVIIGILRLVLYFHGLPEDVRDKLGEALDKARDAKDTTKSSASADPFDNPE